MEGKARIWFSIAVLMLWGCRSADERVCVAGMSVGSSTAARLMHDSIYIKDSVIVRDKADTVFFTKYRTLYKEKVIRDTLHVCDTLYTERVVTRYVGRESVRCGKWWTWLLLLLPLPLLLPRVSRWLLKIFKNA